MRRPPQALWLLLWRAMTSSGHLVVNPAISGALEIGKFSVGLSDQGGASLVVRHEEQDAGDPLWESMPGQPFLRCALGIFTTEEHQGNFHVTDEVVGWTDLQTIDYLRQSSRGSVVIGGTLSFNDTPDAMRNQTSAWIYEVELREETDRRLGLVARVGGKEGGGEGGIQGREGITHIQLQYRAPERGVKVFGFGAQYTFLNLRGQTVPIWVSEQGVGRGLQPLTRYLNHNAHGAGGNPWTTYAPLPYYVTSQGRSLFLKNTEYALFDLTEPSTFRVHIAASPSTPSSKPGEIQGPSGPAPLTLEACLVHATSVPEAVSEFSRFNGRMAPLPQWVSQGAIVGLQGGTEVVLSRLASLEAAGVPLAGLWLQDWSGKRMDSFGSRVLWNWILDPQRYPGWEEMLQTLLSRGVRVLSYINPYLAANVTLYKPDVARDLFTEAAAAGYLVQRDGGGTYIQTSGSDSFQFGTLDLTNPAAVQWYKDIIKCHLLCVCGDGPEANERAEQVGTCGQGGSGTGVGGWMADFGEYLPTDAIVKSGQPADRLHNAFPTLWAQLNREAVQEAGREHDTVFFMRSAFLGSSAHSRVYWLGDQLATWDMFDGLASAVTGLLSSGLSGMALTHSDLGGYTSLSIDINGTEYKYIRSKELLLRWMELSAFSDVMFRSHEGNQPTAAWQVYSDSETLSAFARFATIFAALGDYRSLLMAEAAAHGWPLVRPIFWHYPEEDEAWALAGTQFMVGPHVLMAPVLKEGGVTVDVYLPRGRWVGLWDCNVIESQQGTWLLGQPAPLGYPAVFTVAGSQVRRDLAVKAGGVAGLMACSSLADEVGPSYESRAATSPGAKGLEMERRGLDSLQAEEVQQARIDSGPDGPSSSLPSPGLVVEGSNNGPRMPLTWPLALLGLGMLVSPFVAVVLRALCWLTHMGTKRGAHDNPRHLYTSIEMADAAGS